MSEIVELVLHDPDDGRITIERAIVDDGVDLKKAIKAAAAEYVATADGREQVDINFGGFNFYDATGIPEAITKKHGYIFVDRPLYTIVDANESVLPEDRK